MNKIFSLVVIAFLAGKVSSQTSDNQYARPLSEIITDIEERYNISIRYDEKLVANKYIAYAEWRYRPDVEKTLKNVLAAVDLIAQKEGDNKYKNGEIDESLVIIEDKAKMFVIGNQKENLPSGAVTSFEELVELVEKYLQK